MPDLIRKTRSICPVCRKNLPTDLLREENGCIYLEKKCPDHGRFRTVIWRGKLDFEVWTAGSAPLKEKAGVHCPDNCGLCSEHESGTCCILLEVTKRCNLKCRYCFANGGSSQEDLSADELKKAILDISEKCEKPLIQFSGGEPTLRDDLPELIRFAKEAGCSYAQVNTNGIRLAEDPAYAKRLKDAGLDIIFLQFDGTRDDIYKKLRGRALLSIKKKAISVCSELKIGVTLVPTVVKGVNEEDLGAIVRLACSLVPGVRGIHFQPVSYFGRFPEDPSDEDRYTLDQLITDLCDQCEIPVESFLPSRCDHPLCGFHAGFLIEQSRKLNPLSTITHSSHSKGCAKENRAYIARHWMRSKDSIPLSHDFSAEMDFDTFLYRLRHASLTLTAMAFQDAGNLNVERLRRCSLHVYKNGRILPFCSNYIGSK